MIRLKSQLARLERIFGGENTRQDTITFDDFVVERALDISTDEKRMSALLAYCFRDPTTTWLDLMTAARETERVQSHE
jgi:hypothetical protein